MKYIATLITIGTIVIFSACSQFAGQTSGSNSQDIFDLPKAKQGPVIAKVNNTTIHQGLLDILKEQNPRISQQLTNPIKRKQIIDTLIDQQLIYQEAIKQGMQNSEEVILKTLFMRHGIIMNELLKKEIESAMVKEYDKKKDEQFTKLKVAIIAAYFKPEVSKKDKKKNVEPTQAEIDAALIRINNIKARITKGEDFEKIAKKESDDKMTAKKGGLAGKISKDDKRFARLGYTPLVNTAFKMKKDQVSDPIKLPNGYFLLKVLSDPMVIPFEDAKRVLGFELQAKIKDSIIKRLKANAKIEYAQKETPKAKENKAPVNPLIQQIQQGIKDSSKKKEAAKTKEEPKEKAKQENKTEKENKK